MSNTLSMSLSLQGLAGFEIVSVRVLEGLSERTTAVVEVATSEDVDWASAVGRVATLSITGAEERTLHLELGEASFLENRDNAFRFALHLHDPLYRLGLSLSTRKFRDVSAQAIVTKLLDEHRIAHRWKLRNETPDRPYCVQYRESNLAFIERLLEFEGIFYAFAGDGVLLLEDWSPAADRLRGGAPFELIEAAGALHRGEVGIHELRRGVRITTGRVTLGDYNWKRPDVPLRETASGDGDVALERFEFPAGYRKPDRGVALAKLRVEAHRAQSAFLTGKGNAASFAPGAAFRLGDQAGDSFAGHYLLVHVEHHYRVGAFSEGGIAAGGATTYENHFKAIPLELPFRPPVKTPRPTIAGSHTAMVRGPAGSEIHTDKFGRFRAQLHWDREAVGTDDDSRWLRITQEASSSMVLARTGWEMMVGHIDGDPDRPIGLARAINGLMAPSYGLPAHKNRMTVKTPSSPATGGFSELMMDDSAGSQQIAMRAEKDLEVVVKNDKSEKVENDETHTVGADFKREIFGNQSIAIGKNDSAKYGATSDLKVAKNRTVKVGGSESIDVGAGKRVTIGASDSEKVGAVRTSIVGSIKMPDWKAMATSALNGLVPDSAKALMALKKGGGGALKGLVSSAATSAANAAGAALVDPDSAGPGAAIQGSLAGSVGSAIGVTSSTPGQLPTLGDLGNQYSSLATDTVVKVKGAVGTATGGLSDMVWKDEKDGKRQPITFGLDQVDQLVGLFCQGGIARNAAKSLKKVVGGAYVQAALGPISWGSAGMLAETIGAVKLTTTPKEIGQTVAGTMVVSVLGKILRDAKGALSILAKDSAIKVGGMAQYAAVETLEISAGGAVTITAGQKLVLNGGADECDSSAPPKSSATATKSSLVLDGKKVGIESDTKIVFNGKNVNLTKAG